MAAVGYIFLKPVLWLLGRLPLGFHHAMSGFICWIMKDVLHYRRDVVITNLSRSFPDKKYKEIKSIADRFYHHLSDIIVETIWYGGCSDPARFQRNNPEFLVNPEVIQELYDNSPAVMVLNSHCGNWEFFGSAPFFCRAEGAPNPFSEDNSVVVYKRPSSKTWDRIIRENRMATVRDKKGFDGYVETSEFLRYALNSLNQGKKKIYNMNTDQAPYAKADKVFIGEFLNQPTCSMVGSVRLACKKGMSVAYMNVSYVSRGHYNLTFTPICQDASGHDPLDVLKTYYELLQKDIQAQPWNYLWSHKRWK